LTGERCQRDDACSDVMGLSSDGTGCESRACSGTDSCCVSVGSERLLLLNCDGAPDAALPSRARTDAETSADDQDADSTAVLAAVAAVVAAALCVSVVF